MVCEIRARDGTWYAFMASRPPLHLWDEVYKVREAFYESLGALSAEEIYEHIPVTFPKTNALNPTAFPGISKFPLDLAIKNEAPELTEEGWAVLIMSVASKDMDRLDHLFTMSKTFCDKFKAGAGA